MQAEQLGSMSCLVVEERVEDEEADGDDEQEVRCKRRRRRRRRDPTKKKKGTKKVKEYQQIRQEACCDCWCREPATLLARLGLFICTATQQDGDHQKTR